MPTGSIVDIERLTLWQQPWANLGIAYISNNSSWLLNSVVASHDVTVDLSNLSLNTPYDGSDDIVIGDDTCLFITHTSSKTF